MKFYYVYGPGAKIGERPKVQVTEEEFWSLMNKDIDDYLAAEKRELLGDIGDFFSQHRNVPKNIFAYDFAIDDDEEGDNE